LSTVQGVLTLMIAGIAVYIAWQQWKTNALKVRIDLFDRRMKVYEAVQAFLRHVLMKGGAELSSYGELVVAIDTAEFLFDRELTEYLQKFSKEGLNLALACAEYRDSTQSRAADYDHADVVKRKHEALKWLMDQSEPVKTLFRKHMQIAK
jgi:hypothetical protein